MSVVVYRSFSQLTILKEKWNELAAVPFRTWEWCETWWRIYGESGGGWGRPCELFVVEVRAQAGELLGIAPWFIKSDRWFGKVLHFLGTGEVCSDYLSFLVPPGREKEFSSALIQWLQGDGRAYWDGVFLSAVDTKERSVEAVMNEWEKGLCEVTLSHRTWRLPLPKSWEEYLATRSSKHRSELKKLDRDYLQSGKVTMHSVDGEEARDNGMEILKELHEKRRESIGERGSFGSPRFERFHREMSKAFLKMGALRLQWLEMDSLPVAILYDIAWGNTIHGYMGGMGTHPSLKAPGKLMFISAFKAAIAQGFGVYDFLRGDEPYKSHWRADPIPLFEVRLFSDKSMVHLKRIAWKITRRAKRYRSSLFSKGLDIEAKA